MSSFETLIEKFVAENKCRLMLSDMLVPKVVSWVDKNTKLNVSAHGSIAAKMLKRLAGGAHSCHSLSDGRRRGLDARRGTPGRM